MEIFHSQLDIVVSVCYNFTGLLIAVCISGLPCRELLQKFQHKLVILFKLMMLERRVS